MESLQLAIMIFILLSFLCGGLFPVFINVFASIPLL